MTALAILLIAFLGCIGLGALLLLGLDHRARLARIEKNQHASAKAVAERLSEASTCMLREITTGKKERED